MESVIARRTKTNIPFPMYLPTFSSESGGFIKVGTHLVHEFGETRECVNKGAVQIKQHRFQVLKTFHLYRDASSERMSSITAL